MPLQLLGGLVIWKAGELLTLHRCAGFEFNMLLPPSLEPGESFAGESIAQGEPLLLCETWLLVAEPLRQW